MGFRVHPKIFAALACLASLHTSPAVVRAQDPADPYREDLPAFNDWGARTFLIEVQPLVQKYTGWKHDAIPGFRLVTRGQYLAAITEESQRYLPNSLGSVPLTPQLRASMTAHVTGLLGRYSRYSKMIYLLPGNLKPVMRSLGVEDRFTRDLVEIVCAHEMTHAFQDERHPFLDPMAFPNQDAWEAYAMLTEGHAVFVQQRVARELGVDEASQKMIEQMTFHQATGASQGSSTNLMRRYTDGHKFVEAVYKRSGLPGVQRLFEHPPTSTAAVINPEIYFALEDQAKAQTSAR